MAREYILGQEKEIPEEIRLQENEVLRIVVKVDENGKWVIETNTDEDVETVIGIINELMGQWLGMICVPLELEDTGIMN